jgi:hypothetical protein
MKQTLNEQVARIKMMMNLNEDDSQAMLMQYTQEFNEKVDEDLTPEEFKEVMCTDPDSIELPQDITSEQKQTVDQLKQKMKTASFAELLQAKRQLKELKRQQQNEQVAEAGLISFLGVSMPPAFAMAIGGVMFIMLLTVLSRFFKFTRTETYWCDGKKSRLFGLLRW